ncbi:MAG TPA: phage holin family protein [Solirubrobacteraceae bacterium]
MSDATPVEIPSEQAFGRRFPFLRVIVIWIVNAATLYLLAAVMSGFNIKNAGAAFVAAAIIGLLNALLWPFVIRIALPFTVLTLGLGVLVLNGALIALVAAIYPSIEIRNVASGIVVAFGLTLATTFVTSLLAIDDDDFFFRNVVRKRIKPIEGMSDTPGLFFLEIDGLAHAVVQRAIRDGNAPTMARWLREGSHTLLRWETDWSSQTGACQAGLLHGNNHDMPAFRWWEKETQRAIVTNHPKDAAEIERRQSDGRGLLYSEGASRANILSGDAPHSLLTMSTALQRGRGRIGQDYYAYFANPYSVLRTALFAVREVFVELSAASQQRRRDVQPRIERGFTYALMRAWATIIQRDLQVASIIGDLAAGRPVAYTTFLAYDEVAHHSGVERADTLTVLRHVDRELGRIAAAAREAPRPYHFVVLADHGQSQGATFLQRYGESLEDVVERACNAPSLALTEGHDSGSQFLDASVTEARLADTRTGRMLKRATKHQTVDDAVLLGPDRKEHRAEIEAAATTPKGEEPPEIVVMASGCLGLVSFPRENGRVTLERFEERYPALLPTLLEHEGIGFVLVRSAERGAVVLGARGRHELDTGLIEGEDPLAPFGPNAAHHVKRTDEFPHCADLMVNSTYWAESDEVAAFEELVGSHGGMGGEQSFPFALVPSEFALPEEPVVGSEEMHRHMRRWLADLGQTDYAEVEKATPPAELPPASGPATP